MFVLKASSPASAPAPRFFRSEWLRLLALVGLLLLGRSTLANHYHVPTGSMEPTVHPGDRIAVDMTAYGITLPFTQLDLIRRGQPDRGDVVVFDSPVNGTRLVKRVVAVEGDEVSVKQGHVFINGRPIAVAGSPAQESLDGHRFHLDLSRGGGPDVDRWGIPAGQVLVLGDARGNSVDGRFFGLVPIDSIYGRAVAVYYRSGQGLAWDRL